MLGAGLESTLARAVPRCNSARDRQTRLQLRYMAMGTLFSIVQGLRCRISGKGRAFSDLLGKFLVPMKLGKNYVILGKIRPFLEKNSAIFSNIGKINLLNWDFFTNWECSRSIGNFFSQLGKLLVPETGPSFV